MAIKRLGGVTYKAGSLIYSAHILSRVRYNLCSWSQCNKFQVEQVGKLMNKALKIIHNLNPRTPTRDLYRLTNQLDINQLIFFEKCKYVYKIKNSLLKSKNSS